MTDYLQQARALCRYCTEIIYPVNAVIWVTDCEDQQTRWCFDRPDGVPRHHAPRKGPQ